MLIYLKLKLKRSIYKVHVKKKTIHLLGIFITQVYSPKY